MDQSRRAVEAYWRSRTIDEVTADEDKVAPVYKLEEVCELLRASPAGVVKEISDYILRRLDHRSPVVKQKALRLIKYAVGKSGNEFRREMQRNSAAVRQLFHYKGHVDPLKGDSLNKAVRDTAHETIAAVFSTDDNKAIAPSQEGLGKRIQGFGNTNFQMVTEDKKSFLSEVVGRGSASIKQSFNTFTNSSSSRKNDFGNYKSPALRRSLTTEIDSHHEYQGDDLHRENWISSGALKTATASVIWGSSTENLNSTSAANIDTSSSNMGSKSREERLLETIVTSGGVRLQPTRDALQTFHAEATKSDALSMSHALDIKLQSHLWQVRMKALCVLESILQKKDEEYFSILASYFTENTDSVVRCTELPQVSLREKATKVLSLLDADQTSRSKEAVKPSNRGATDISVVHMPNLIDTGDLEDDSQNSTHTLDDQSTAHLKQSGSMVDALFENDNLADLRNDETRIENDPFSDVSFHMADESEQNDLFSGLTVDNITFGSEINAKFANKTDLTNVFDVNSEQLPKEAEYNKSNVNDLMAGLSLNNVIQNSEQHGLSGALEGDFSGVNFLNNSSQPKQPQAYGTLNGNSDLNPLYNQVLVHHNMPPNIMFNQNFPSQPVNYAAMGALIAQQKILLQNLGSFNSAFGHKAMNPMEGIYTPPLPDIFQLGSDPIQNHAPVRNNSKEETKAFDFISDHLAAARDSKRLF